jgi:hypothetical protein
MPRDPVVHSNQFSAVDSPFDVAVTSTMPHSRR